MLSGSIIGGILRGIGIAKREKAKESYKDLLVIGAVWSAFMFVVSLLILFLGATLIGTLLETSLAWLLPETIIESITAIATFGAALWTALVIGIYSFASLFIGAGIIDIAHSIAKRV